MRAGQLRHKVTIQMPVETQNEYGEPTVRWQNFAANVWAWIGPLKGREYFSAKQMVAEIAARIDIRYLIGVTAKMKVVHGINEYLIEEIINDEERDRSLSLMCTRFIP